MMKALATKSPGAQSAKSRQPTPPVHVLHALSASSFSHPMLQRKPNCACGGGCPRCKAEASLQPKLKINQPNDRYEQEADRVAEQVMRMPEREVAGISSSPAKVQRKCADEEEKIQAKEAPGQTPTVTSEVQTQIDSLRGGGQPLPESARTFFEARFGHDFSQVRVHTNSQAAESAQALGAEAFTNGPNIVFAPNSYELSSFFGRQLLAHELSHVIQQGHAISTRITAPVLSHPGKVVMPYRPKGSPNFGVCDDAPNSIEKPFTSKDTDPWIETISIHFDGTMIDSDGDLVPKGKLKAEYFANSAKLPDIANVSILGGAASEGLTDQGNHKVHRIEGCGYDATIDPIPKGEQLKGSTKYFKPSLVSKANMSFAVFFSGKQAIHAGSLDTGSLSCVHVGDNSTIRQINYHSVKSKGATTQVKVSYDAAVLKKVCCERFKVKGYMVSNPCKGQKSKECP